MSGWFNSFFGREGMFGPPLRLLSALPSAKRGQLRPGHLSVAVAQAKNKAQRRGVVVTPPRTPAQSPGRTGVVPTPKTPAQSPGRTGVVPAPRTPAQSPGRTGVVPAPRTPAQSPGRTGVVPAPRTPAQSPGRTGVVPGARTPGVQTFAQKPPPPSVRGASQRLSGLGDVDPDAPAFVGNAGAWVTVEKRPLRAMDPVTGAAVGAVRWPDGSLVSGTFWLPKLDLSQVFRPELPGTLWQGSDPLTRKRPDGSERRQERGGGWVQTDQAADRFGGARAWEWRIDYGVGADHNGFMTEWPEPPDEEPFRSLYYFTLHDHVDRSLSDWTGHSARINRWASSFDWSVNPPTSQAPVWLWLNLFDPRHVTWTVQQAEVYRADLQDMANAGEPTTLPGAAWLCLDVLDAMITGAHGMPVMVRDDGTLDPEIFTTFLQAHPDWAPLLDFGRNNAGMLAIVNDLGAFGGAVVHVTPPPPPPKAKPLPRTDPVVDTKPPPPVVDTPPPPAADSGPPPGYYDGGDGYYYPIPTEATPPPPAADSGPPPGYYDGGDGYYYPIPTEATPPPRGPDPYYRRPPMVDEYSDSSGDAYLDALLELITYLVGLEEGDFVGALLLLDEETFAIVAAVLGLEEMAA